MRIAYVEMIGGAAGDMLMGAWIDAGADPLALEAALRGVVAEGWEFTHRRVRKAGIAATHVDLVIPGEDHHAHDEHGNHVAPAQHGRHLRDVLEIVQHSTLTPRQIERATRVYQALAHAEAHVHGHDADAVHFHEVGQIDAILDVAGTCIALDLLGIDELRVSAFPTGTGVTRMHHGTYPNPGPATLELLRGWPLRGTDLPHELVTTTGAAILTTLATSTGAPSMQLERVGYGAGRMDLPVPNVVRIAIGTTAASSDGDGDEVVVLDANIDDMSPQHYELALERIFAAGALDAWLTPIVMKKGRPAITLSAIGRPNGEAAIAHAMLRETSTLGVRVRRERRHVLPREVELIDTPFGAVRVKVARADGRIRRLPEYDDVVRIARERDLPIADVARLVQVAADAELTV